MKSLAFACALSIASAGPCFAWGDRGHSIVAEIALHHLSEPALKEVQRLLGKESLAGVASWADDYKFTEEGKHTYDWHFADVDVTRDKFDKSKDCIGPNGCLVTALAAQVDVLGNKSKTDAERRQALLMLVHLVGDSTQPFHCTERNHDQGGNKVKADFEGKRPDGKLRPVPDTNLHAVWDDSLIDNRAYAWGNYAAELEAKVVPLVTDVTYNAGFAEAWINECHTVGQKLYKELPAPNADNIIVLGDAYQTAVAETLDRQLATGGLRLAVMLNTVLEK
ncbi:S1/P1 nuclease [Mesorhizobium sp. M4B.F.Ca.ET.017.02.2.1]|uniref:S1/P1 nuclease n=1 Tax=Mesorhizobium sp. M4B.F.Ca.ET.017.02.2.1 TaxID=2496649 RepID=UPI000FCB5D87|nr:S1/P1 nuclease [Mesorhizobium sp. M4B.F.Ca.ET.017.02.2.1]RVD31782.1 hypothetical protein EN738_00200 [Mesorhizobium sp. M4B.F.Ca.ET.017.02.2.1]